MATTKKEEIAISPKQYFEHVKGLKNVLVKEDVEKYIQVQDTLMKKAVATGQDFQLQKLEFLSNVLQHEIKLIDAGLTTYVRREDIVAYADKITDKSIRIIELKNYPREIPNEVADLIVRTKKQKLFDEYFVVYTDYAEMDPALKKKIQKERDPILFGAYCKTSNDGLRVRTETLHERMYYLADWEDEYCDLTLSKMVDTMAREGKNIVYSLNIPVTAEDIRARLENIKEVKNSEKSRFTELNNNPKKPSFFSKINIFKRATK